MSHLIETKVILYQQKAIFLCCLVRDKIILIPISFLLLVVLAMTDSKLLLLEKEELTKSIEVELEEVKEGKADRHAFNHLSNGSDDMLAANIHFFRSALQFTLVYTTEQQRTYHTSHLSLFIKYCCLKIHLA